MIITLPWIKPKLSPNARVHWSVRSKLAKADRQCARLIVQSMLSPWQGCGEIPMTVTFCPPDKRKRDRDNMIASSKHLFDGVADALEVDDSRFVMTFRVGEPRKGGCVQVEVLS